MVFSAVTISHLTEINLVVSKDLYNCCGVEINALSAHDALNAVISWDPGADDVRLIKIKANHDSILNNNTFLSSLYEGRVIEPNTDYNCIKINNLLLFMVRKDSIQEYKNVVIDRIPIEKLIKIKDENIINFVHWAISYDHNAFQCVYECMGHFLKTAFRMSIDSFAIMMKRVSVDHAVDDVCNYIIDQLDGIQSSDINKYKENVKIIGNAIIDSSNLKEEYQKCLSKNKNKNDLLENIRSSTEKALKAFRSINRELYGVNIAKTLLYNKSAEMFYRNMEKIEQHYEFYIDNKAGKQMIPHLYFITDNSKTIISFLLMLLGTPSYMGIPLCVERLSSTFNSSHIWGMPIVEYVADCDKKEISAHISQIKPLYESSEEESCKIVYVVVKADYYINHIWELNYVEFKRQDYLYLFYIINKIRIFIKQYYGIMKILSDNNAIMVVPSIRFKSAVSLLL